LKFQGILLALAVSFAEFSILKWHKN